MEIKVHLYQAGLGGNQIGAGGIPVICSRFRDVSWASGWASSGEPASQVSLLLHQPVTHIPPLLTGSRVDVSDAAVRLTPSPSRAVRLHHPRRRVITMAETMQRRRLDGGHVAAKQSEECRVSLQFAGCRRGSSGHR